VSGLTNVLERAGARLAAAPDGHLALGAREEVWAQLGPRGEQPGLGRRARLASGSCERVLGLWDRMRPGDRNPHAALDTARAVLLGDADREAARAQAGRLWGHAENVSQLAGDPQLASVGFACAKVIGVALHDEFFDPAALDPDRDDTLLDASEVDAAYMAALAAAGGKPEDPASDAAARRAFWAWWLDAAREL
jgi:hypothetical protein